MTRELKERFPLLVQFSWHVSANTASIITNTRSTSFRDSGKQHYGGDSHTVENFTYRAVMKSLLLDVNLSKFRTLLS
jgi:hypothetical protein